MVSRLECTRVHFVQVSVLVSRPEGQDLKAQVLVSRPVPSYPMGPRRARAQGPRASGGPQTADALIFHLVK